MGTRRIVLPRGVTLNLPITDFGETPTCFGTKDEFILLIAMSS